VVGFSDLIRGFFLAGIQDYNMGSSEEWGRNESTSTALHLCKLSDPQC